MLHYQRRKRAVICLHCSTQQSDLVLQSCDVLRLRVQKCLETVEPVSFGAGGVGDGYDPRGHGTGTISIRGSAPISIRGSAHAV